MKNTAKQSNIRRAVFVLFFMLSVFFRRLVVFVVALLVFFVALCVFCSRC